ncbi:MAG: tRNA lysidine(34) synthetase TilS [Bacteroidetes bacterium]|nr:tRNA lysidine(34) synthetase TilS [Bacteroidota bacterium]
MIRKFESFISENQLIRKTDRLLLAVSGGMDSMAMAELFRLAAYDYAFIHCNFKLRGSDSEADHAFVKETAQSHGVPFFSRSFETQEIADNTGESVQMVARDLRYAYFSEIAQKEGFDIIAIGHNLDDQIETFFINLSRGCGIAGLHGIRMKQGKLIRPVMFASREDIEEFIRQNNIAYREDASNQSLKYKRNLIRHKLIPLFVELNPNFREEMGANISRLSGTEEVYRQFVDEMKQTLWDEKDNSISIDIAGLMDLHPIRTFLFEFISPYGYNAADVENIITALDNIPGKMFFSASHRLLIDRKKILLTKLNEKDGYASEYTLKREDLFLAEPVTLKISMRKAGDYKIPLDQNIASLDYDKLAFPLMLRRWKAGDLFIPLGMKNRKKLSDFFIDEKFSRLQKEQTWVLCSGEDVAWIVGSRIDERYRITSETKDVYKIELC